MPALLSDEDLRSPTTLYLVFISNLRSAYGGREGNLSSPGGLGEGLPKASLKLKGVNVREVQRGCTPGAAAAFL